MVIFKGLSVLALMAIYVSLKKNLNTEFYLSVGCQ